VGDVTGRAVEQALRQSYGKLIAFLSARSRDVAAAEDALSDAFAAALHSWPKQGVPDNPDAWLLTVARRRIIDQARLRQVRDEAQEHLLLLAELAQRDDQETSAASIPDDRLLLMFACAHPALDVEIHAPMMLQTVLGLDAVAIASAFLVSPATMGQRLVRAKNKIKQARIPFRLPQQEDLGDRLHSVLDAIYAVYTQGWADPIEREANSRQLAQEAVWLARVVAALLPDEPEALGLLALLLYAQARQAARRSATGAYVPLSEQDVALWNRTMVDEAESLLQRAAPSNARALIGRFQLEAAIQSAHTVRLYRPGPSDWPAIAALYEALWTLTGSPVVAINRAVALSQSAGAEPALAQLDQVASDKRLLQYQPYWAARAPLLAQAGRRNEARDAYNQAIGLETDPAVRSYLQAQRDAVG
jgi:RNA polymerase sigma-70 factor, ECF subfamily